MHTLLKQLHSANPSDHICDLLLSKIISKHITRPEQLTDYLLQVQSDSRGKSNPTPWYLNIDMLNRSVNILPVNLATDPQCSQLHRSFYFTNSSKSTAAALARQLRRWFAQLADDDVQVIKTNKELLELLVNTGPDNITWRCSGSIITLQDVVELLTLVDNPPHIHASIIRHPVDWCVPGIISSPTKRFLSKAEHTNQLIYFPVNVGVKFKENYQTLMYTESLPFGAYLRAGDVSNLIEDINRIVYTTNPINANLISY